MTLLQKRKLFLFKFWFNMHFPRNSRHIEFSGYLDLMSKTFLMPIGLLQEFVLCRCKKIFLNQIVAILELAAKYFYLKTNKQRWKHTRHSEYI